MGTTTVAAGNGTSQQGGAGEDGVARAAAAAAAGVASSAATAASNAQTVAADAQEAAEAAAAAAADAQSTADSKLSDLGVNVITASPVNVTRASHANRVNLINSANPVSLVFANGATSGAQPGDCYLFLNIGAGLITASGAISAPAGYALTAAKGVGFGAFYSGGTDDANYSTTPSAAGVLVPVTVSGTTAADTSNLIATVLPGWSPVGNWTRDGVNISGATSLAYAKQPAEDGGHLITFATPYYIAAGISVAAGSGSGPFAPTGPASLLLPSGFTGIAALTPHFIDSLRQSSERHAVGVFLGDSTTAGYSGTSSASYMGARPFTPVEKFMDTLESYGFKVNRQNFLGEQNVAATGTTPNQYDSRISLGSGWTVAAIGQGSLGGNGYFGSGSGALSFACSAPVDRCVVFYASDPDGGGAVFTVDVGGSALGTGDCTQSQALRKTDVINLGALATPTINIRRTSGTAYIVGLMAWNSANPGVTILNAGWGGAKVADFISAAQAYNVLPSLANLGHDFALVSMLINDWRANTSSSTFGTQTAALIDAAKAGGTADVILFQGPRSASSDTALATQDGLIAQYNALVTSKTVPLINATTDLGENTGLPNYVDGIGHLSRAANVKLGTDLALRLLNGYTVGTFGVAATPFFTDTFTDTNGTALTAHTPNVTPGGGWVTPVGSYEINGNAARSASNGGIGAVLLGPDSPTNNYQIRVDFNGSSGGTGDGPIFRGVDGSNFAFTSNNGAPDVTKLSRFLSGSESSYTTGATSSNSPRSMEISVVGPTTTVRVGGVVVVAGAVPDLVNARKFGMRMAGTVGANTIDNYNVYSIAMGTPFARAFTPSAERVIWDTDIGTDADDIAAGLLLHGMRLAGEANILCMTTATRAANSVNALYAINNYKGLTSIPLGVAAASTFTSTNSDINGIATGSYGAGGPGLSAANAVTLIRQQLNAAPDGSVVIICTGFAKNMADVLASGANNLGDGIASTGLQLITAKCKRIVCMLGHWGYRSDSASLGTAVEFNAGADGSSTDYLINNWPAAVPMYMAGYELGAVFSTNIVTALISVARPAWDPIAMVFGVRGTSWGGTQYWALNQGQMYSHLGGTGFIPDPAANKFVLREFASTSAVAAQLNALAGS